MSKKLKQKENIKKIQSRASYSFIICIILFSFIYIFGLSKYNQMQNQEPVEPPKIEYSDELVTTPEIEKIDGVIFDDQSEIIAETVVENKNNQPEIETVSVKPKIDYLRNLNNHERIIFKECQSLDMSIEETAFVLANANHETAQFKFLEEINGEAQALRLGYKGGKNWYGRGYIQLTHITNYQQWSKWTNRDLVSNPDILTKDLQLSAFIACSGVKHGSFTNKGKLADYKKDWYNARALVNGDKNYRAGCNSNGCWTIGTKIKDLTNQYIAKIK